MGRLGVAHKWPCLAVSERQASSEPHIHGPNDLLLLSIALPFAQRLFA